MEQVLGQIATMTDSELDGLIAGIVRVDRNGTIEYYNRTEAEIANRTSADTVGLNFFRDVAPCTAVKEFRGRFDDFVASERTASAPFEFFYPFGWGRRQVKITILRHPADSHSFFIVNEFSPADD